MYVGGNILSILLDAKMSGAHNSKGKLFNENQLGFLMSSTGIFNDSIHGYGFSANKGKLYRDNRDGAIPIRLVYK